MLQFRNAVEKWKKNIYLEIFGESYAGKIFRIYREINIHYKIIR